MNEHRTCLRPAGGICEICHTWKKKKNKVTKREKKLEASNFSGENMVTKDTSIKVVKKRKYRQANVDAKGKVEVLCFTCRRNPSQKVQKTMGSFFSSSSSFSSPSSSSLSNINFPCCSRCRQPLKKVSKTSSIVLSKCPFIKRLDGYKKIASDNQLPYDLSDSAAVHVMRKPCTFCNHEDGINGNGLTRLRIWPERHESAKNGKGKQFMGPFCIENIQSACSMCNLMKGARKPRGYIESMRHIATYRKVGCDIDSSNDQKKHDFGLYPHRFRNNISKRSRSSYITKSSTHTKTHSMTNEMFNEITSKPCHYCGKCSSPDTDPPHYNGLDRLDSNERVYSINTVVSCCGDCNVMNYTHSEDVFLNHALKVARHHENTKFIDGDEDRYLDLDL
jgi:hypothetical protein